MAGRSPGSAGNGAGSSPDQLMTDASRPASGASAQGADPAAAAGAAAARAAGVQSKAKDVKARAEAEAKKRLSLPPGKTLKGVLDDVVGVAGEKNTARVANAVLSGLFGTALTLAKIGETAPWVAPAARALLLLADKVQEQNELQMYCCTFADRAVTAAASLRQAEEALTTPAVADDVMALQENIDLIFAYTDILEYALEKITKYTAPTTNLLSRLGRSVVDPFKAGGRKDKLQAAVGDMDSLRIEIVLRLSARGVVVAAELKEAVHALEETLLQRISAGIEALEKRAAREPEVQSALVSDSSDSLEAVVELLLRMMREIEDGKAATAGHYGVHLEQHMHGDVRDSGVGNQYIAGPVTYNQTFGSSRADGSRS